MTTPKLAEQVRGKGRMYRDPRDNRMKISVTNAQGALSKPALPRWAAIEVAKTAYKMRHALAEMEEGEAVDMLKGSPWSTANRAADRGSSVHELLEVLTRGGKGFDLSGEASDYQPQIMQFLSEHEVEPWYTEVTVFGEDYAGTADFIGLLDGIPVVMDYKTGKKKLYDDVALQLSALRYAEVMVTDDGEVLPMPDTAAGVGVLIKPSGYEIREVADPEFAFQTFLSLLEVRKWQIADADVLVEWHRHEG
jgi:hypothetical protein